MRPTRVLGARGLFLVEDQADSTMNLYASSGKRLQNCSGLVYHAIVAAVMDESSDAIMVLSYEVDDDENDFPLIVSIIDRQGEVSLRYKVAGSYGESTSSLAAVEDSGYIFVLFRSAQGRRLVALNSSSKRLEQIYEVSVPGNAVLVCDERMTMVKLVVSAVDGPVQTVSLGGERPVLDAGDGDGTLSIPRLAPPFPLCSASYNPVAAVADLPAHMVSAVDSDLLNWVEKRVDHYRYHSQELTGLVKALMAAERNAVIESAIARQLKKGETVLLCVYATALLDGECWEEAIRTLRPGLPPAHDWSEQEKGHTAHLFGIALYRSGRIEQALAVWQSAGVDNFCELQPYIDLAGYFVKSEQPGQTTADAKLLHSLIRRLQEADRYLDAENYRAAIETLDCPLVWTAREMQSLARLVCSLLKEEHETPAGNFIRLMAVSLLLKATDSSRDFGFGRPQLSFPGEWRQARIDSVVGQARAWWDSRVARS